MAACNHSHHSFENLHIANSRQQGTQKMSNKITIAISAALLLAATASAVSAAAPGASTTSGAIATVCSEDPSLQARHCGAGPHCQYLNISDRTVGPTFPTTCRQAT